MLRLGAIQEVQDEIVSSARNRSSKAFSYPKHLSNSPTKLPRVARSPNESLERSNQSQSNNNSNDFITLKSPKRIPHSSQLNNTSFETNWSPKKVSTLETLKTMNSPTSKSLTKDKHQRFLQSSIDLIDTKEKVQSSNGNNMDNYLNLQFESSAHDWSSISRHEAMDQETEKVRKLEAWQFEMVKEKNPLNQENDGLFTNKYKLQKKPQEDRSLPSLNVKLIQTILSPSEEEKVKYLDVKKNLSSSMRTEPTEMQKNGELGEGVVQSLQNAIREKNQELLLDLISKKIKDFFDKIDVNDMNKEQLKLYTRTIATSVADQFKSLKNATHISQIQNRVEYMMGKIQNSKLQQMDDLNTDLKLAKRNAKTAVDYKFQENSLLKGFEDALENVKNINERLMFLNKQNLKLNTQIRTLVKQLENQDKPGSSSISSMLDVSLKEEDKKTKKLDLEKILALIHDRPEHHGHSDVEYKLMKPRHEKKKKRAEAENKIRDVHDQLMIIGEEIQSTEKELNSAKHHKMSCKIQLKNLYQKILKDEITMIDESNSVSYLAVVRAMLKMDGEVKPLVFPEFLDQTSTDYMIHCARLQAQLETHCQQNELLFLIANLEEFKDTLNLYNFNPKLDTFPEQKSSPLNRIGTLSRDFSPHIDDIPDRDFNTLLDKFKDKMSAMKKVNLKAKRLTNVTFYNSKGKNTISKWEDIDPDTVSSGLISQSRIHIKDEGSLRNFDRSFKLDVDAVKNAKSPLEKALEVLDRLKAMKEKEIARMIKYGLTKESDEKHNVHMKKIFRFLFGRKDGEKGYFEWFKEKQKENQRNKRQNNLNHHKISEPENTNIKKPAAPKNHQAESQIWMTPKPDHLIEYGFVSPGRLNASSKIEI